MGWKGKETTMTKTASEIMDKSILASAHQPRETNEYDGWTLEKLADTLREKYGEGFPMDEEALATASQVDKDMVETYFRKNRIVF